MLELPRAIEQTRGIKAEEINIDGQKWYRIQTSHHDITAPQSDAGISVGERLEHLFNVCHLLCAECISQTEDVPEQHRHQVILYRNKQEYVSHLRPVDPFADRTNGYYSAPQKTVYFFSPETKILFHEGTHQILAEHFFRGAQPAFRNNFWIAEGIALFMESLKIEENCYKIGDIRADRLYAAKVYQFERNYTMPIRKLTAMSAAEIQSSAEIQRIYSQSATLTHWLMVAEGGRFRKHLWELLHRTYRDTAKPETLSILTGLSYEELDVKYAEFLKTIPE